MATIIEFATALEARQGIAAGPKIYFTPAWAKLRARHLRAHPHCCLCPAQGPKGMSVDHVEAVRLAPHRALDPANLQTLCKPCHDVAKRRHEAQAGNPLAGGVGADGLPIGPAHPWNSGR